MSLYTLQVDPLLHFLSNQVAFRSALIAPIKPVSSYWGGLFCQPPAREESRLESCPG